MKFVIIPVYNLCIYKILYISCLKSYLKILRKIIKICTNEEKQDIIIDLERTYNAAESICELCKNYLESNEKTQEIANAYKYAYKLYSNIIQEYLNDFSENDFELFETDEDEVFEGWNPKLIKENISFIQI